MSILPTIILLIVIPLPYNEFNIEKLSEYAGSYQWFCDLDNNNLKESLLLANDEMGDMHMYLRLSDDQNNVIDRYNFKYSIANTKEHPIPICCDINSDGYKEVVLFSQNQDSIFLNLFDYKNRKIILNSRFITTIGGVNENKDILLFWIGEIVGTGKNKLCFSVNGAYSLNPRRVFIYDPNTDSLFCSINTGAAALKGSVLQEDKTMSIIVVSNSVGNTKANYPQPYHDTCCWVFTFDQTLRILSEPIAIGRYPSATYKPIIKSGYAYILHMGNERDSTDKSKILKISPEGILEGELGLGKIIYKRIAEIQINGKHRSFVQGLESKTVEFIPEKFSLTENKLTRFLTKKILLIDEDFDMNGKTDLIFQDESNSDILIFFNDLKNAIKIPFESRAYKPLVTMRYKPENNVGELSIYAYDTQKNHKYIVSKNRFYPLRYGVWLVIYITITGFVYFISWIKERQLAKRQILEDKISKLQLQTLRNQLDPHFAFNALNSVGSAIYKEEKENAYDLFQRFARMMRAYLYVSDKIFRSLQDELQFTKDYLEFQKTRFKSLFDYSIEVNDNLHLENIVIPKLLIQSFVENAVKHAFFKINYKGHIKITAYKKEKNAYIYVEDNGIGIHRSKILKATRGTEVGIEIIKEQVNQINRLYRTSISISITDLSFHIYDRTGTRIDICLGVIPF